ncbi:MAG: HAD family phosphatase [Lachnospiraceae bacterium]|nr:HAD family phosphatase [Lachnospiraceae bacterium]
MQKTVIFDMDGVLLDSEALDHKCWYEIADENELKEIDDVFFKTIGRTEDACIRLLKNKYGEDFDGAWFRQATLDRFDEKAERDGMPVKPYAAECLKGLKNSGYRLALASSTNIDRVRRQLTETHLIEYFDEVIGGGMFKKSKPDPEVFLLACSKLGAVPSETYVIEDSYNGIRAAHAGGMLPIMVPDLVQPDDEIKPLCHKVMKDLREVLEYLTE